jgi:hypothetical protein
MDKMREAAQFGEKLVKEIRGLLNAANPNALRERISVSAACTRTIYWHGWRWFWPKVKIVVTIRDWTAEDQGMQNLIFEQYNQDFIPQKPEFLLLHVHFNRIEKKKEVVS